jgi:osmotically-inducible protein OsmY
MRYAEGRLDGVRARTARRVRPTHGEQPDDVTLGQKVRSEVLGRPEFDRCLVAVDVADGVVHLRGEVPHDTIAKLASAVARVHGVRQVENYLHGPGEVPLNKEAALHATAPGSHP